MHFIPVNDARRAGRGITRLAIVADRLLDETASAVADRGILPDWSDRVPRNRVLLDTYRADVTATMPAWEPPRAKVRRRGVLSRLLDRL